MKARKSNSDHWVFVARKGRTKMVIPKSALLCMAVIALTSACATAQQAWFGGQPPLGAQDERRHLFRPYSAVQLDYLGANYCENLLDKRVNTTSYTHQGFDSNKLDAWNLQFPDDASRIAEAFVWEDEYSGIARLESVRRFELGMLAAHIPGRGTIFSGIEAEGRAFSFLTTLLATAGCSCPPGATTFRAW
jgi:hypothetical protein